MGTFHDSGSEIMELYAVLGRLSRCMNMVAKCVAGTEIVAVHKDMFGRDAVRTRSRSHYRTSLFVERFDVRQSTATKL
jgi:hypothetical protein